MNKYTDLETSKQLKEWGCNIRIDGKCYSKITLKKGDEKLDNDWCLRDNINNIISQNDLRAYDLLWDVCVKYAKEFFGEENMNTDGYSPNNSIRHPSWIVILLQKNKIKEANEYLLEHTIYNPKNK